MRLSYAGLTLILSLEKTYPSASKNPITVGLVKPYLSGGYLGGDLIISYLGLSFQLSGLWFRKAIACGFRTESLSLGSTSGIWNSFFWGWNFGV